MNSEHPPRKISPIDRHARNVKAVMVLLVTVMASSTAWAGEEAETALGPTMIRPSVLPLQRLTDLNEPRSWPALPAVLLHAGIGTEGVFRICVSETGRVTEVETIKTPAAGVRDSWTEAIRRWRYRPLTVGGRPRACCRTVRVAVRTDRYPR